MTAAAPIIVSLSIGSMALSHGRLDSAMPTIANIASEVLA